MLRLMMVLVSLLFWVAIPAIIALVLASALPRLFPGMSFRSRTLTAAASAGCLPMALPVAAILFMGEVEYSKGVAVAALLFVAVLVALLIGLPVALLARRGKEPSGPAADTFD